MKSVYRYLGEEVEFEYSRDISATRRSAIVIGVTQIVVGTDYYLPFLKDMATKYHMIKAYAPTVETPMLLDKDGDLDMDALEMFLLQSDLFDVLVNNIDQEQYREILEAIDDNISYITGIDKSNIGNEIITLFKQLQDFISKTEIFFSDEKFKNELMDLAKNFNRMDISSDKVLNFFTDDGK